LNALLLANVMAEEGKTLGRLVEDLQNKYGRHYYGRRDLRLSGEMIQNALRRAAAGPATLGRYRVQRMEDLDGFKFFVDTPDNDAPDEDAPPHGNRAEAWVLMRGSGTEPLMRVYCEAASPETVSGILDATVAFVQEQAPTRNSAG
jgi:phosphomannomutase